MIYGKSSHHPVQASLALAEEHLQFVLSNPANGLDVERIQFALSLVRFARAQQDDDAKQKARSERGS